MRIQGLLLCAFLIALLGVLTSGGVMAEGEAPLAVVEVTPTLVVPAPHAHQGEVLFKSLESEAPARRLPLQPDSPPLRLQLPAGSLWEVAAEVPGFWVRRQTLAVGSGGLPTRVVLSLWPLGTVSGTVAIKDKKIPRPKLLRVQTLAVPSFVQRAPVPPGALDCPVDEEGRWSCSLPAAVFDLVISSAGLTPAYRWAVEVKAGQTTTLGVIELERGSSVAGWVAAEGGPLTEHCVIRLVPRVAAGADLRTTVDLERTAIERPVRRDGFFQLTGLSPGTYSLEVRQPGYAPAALSMVQVEPAAETFLRDPLVLKRPLDLVFEIVPTLDWLGKPWRAQVIRDTGARLTPVIFEGAASPEGRFEVPDQSIGRFHVTLLDSLGNKVWTRRGLSVSSPAEAAQHIQLDFVDIEGALRLGDLPLAGTLWFGGKNATVSMKMEADKEGSFLGVLPHDGFWPVEIEASEPGLRSLVRVDVRAGATGKARVDIRLPETRIFGRVLDEEGRPVARATVFAEGDGLPQRTLSDEAGGFELRGLQEGVLRLAAQERSRSSDPVFTTLSDGRDVGPIDLRLRRLERHHGSVLAAHGPVPGAQVLVSPYPAAGGGASGTTGTDGSFTVDLPPGVQQVVAAVAAPGFPLKVIGPLAPAELRLLLTGEEGELTLSIPARPGELISKNLSFFVFAGAHLIPLGLLQQWAGAQGETWMEGESMTLRVPRVAPGEYRFCLAPRLAEVMFRGNLAEAEASCAAGQLSPGGTLSLEPALERH